MFQEQSFPCHHMDITMEGSLLNREVKILQMVLINSIQNGAGVEML